MSLKLENGKIFGVQLADRLEVLAVGKSLLFCWLRANEDSTNVLYIGLQCTFYTGYSFPIDGKSHFWSCSARGYPLMLSSKC